MLCLSSWQYILILNPSDICVIRLSMSRTKNTRIGTFRAGTYVGWLVEEQLEHLFKRKYITEKMKKAVNRTANDALNS